MALSSLLGACKRPKPPIASRVWLGPSSGCVETPEHPTSGSFACWGVNDAGQLGDGTTRDSSVPVLIPELRDVAQVAAGRRHTCALLRNGTIACWGDNSRHQLASGTTENSSRPRIVVGLVQAREIVAAGDGTCARLEGGYVRCWGANDRGQLGDGTAVEHSVPAQIRFR